LSWNGKPKKKVKNVFLLSVFTSLFGKTKKRVVAYLKIFEYKEKDIENEELQRIKEIKYSGELQLTST
jgi:hypothetical protein